MEFIKDLQRLLPGWPKKSIRDDRSLEPFQQRLYLNVLLLLNQHHITYSVRDIRDSLYSGPYQEWAPPTEVEAAINYLNARHLLTLTLSEYPQNIDRPEFNVRFNFKSKAACEFATREYQRFLKTRNNMIMGCFNVDDQVTDVRMSVAPRNPFEQLLSELSYSLRFISNDPERPEYREILGFLDRVRSRSRDINHLYNRVETITDDLLKATSLLEGLGITLEPGPILRDKLLKHKLSKEF